MKRVSVLGATGSIGQNTLDLVARAPQDYRVVALTGGRNIDRLARDARRFGAELAVTSEPGLLPGLRAALEGSGIEAAAGPQALCEAAARPADWVMSAIVGFAGLAPGLAALRQGATLALANKESMVAAGPLVLATARASGARVLPVDSEHSAVFQALAGEDMASVETVTITASGGAFRDWPLERLRHATPEEAATHPNWDMGQRITVDSASMFNKALEFLETKEFFSLDPARIKVLIHPESLLHAIVTHVDGGMIAHVGPHDMRHAIGYALHWPERRPLPLERLDLARIGRLSFAEPDEARWPALRLAREVAAMGGLAGAAFNGAKEAALDAFLAREIAFTGMAEVVEDVLDRLSAHGGLNSDQLDLDNVAMADQMARDEARRTITRRAA